MLDTILPRDISNVLNTIPYQHLCELRIRSNDSIMVNILGENYYLSLSGITKSINEAIKPSNGLLQSIIQKISNNSIYAINDQLIDGYIVVPGGIRIGVCGDVVSVDNKVKTLKNISSINFRFPHFIKNCSLNIYPYIINEGQLKNTLIVSPPGAGKTTYLRDIVYQLSIRENLLNILVLDERCEISTVFDGQEIHKLKNIDVYTNSTKKFGFNNGIRSMKPDVIVTDEISIEKDIDDIENALTCGVKVIASMHASSINDLKNKPGFRSILSKKLFERFVLLSNVNGVGTLEGVFNENLIYLGV